MKFKVGDKVKVIEFERLEKKFSCGRDFSNGRTFTTDMQKFCGAVVTIKTVNTSWYKIHEDGDKWYWDDNMFEPANRPKIVITTDGKETLARLYEGDKVIKSATAKCSPDDTFDFETGARIAFDRLFAEEKKEEKPKIKVGDRVKVVDSGKAYTHYVSWFEKNAPEHLSHYAYDKSIECGTIGTVKKIAKHLDCNTQLYAISVGYMDTIYLINEDGIERA